MATESSARSYCRPEAIRMLRAEQKGWPRANMNGNGCGDERGDLARRSNCALVLLLDPTSIVIDHYERNSAAHAISRMRQRRRIAGPQNRIRLGRRWAMSLAGTRQGRKLHCSPVRQLCRLVTMVDDHKVRTKMSRMELG